jgi:aryl-alcohol dehydrogenase-like predicted oxidoreductase
MGRRVEQVVENYTPENFRAWNDRSRENLGVETLDLVQLHCPPTGLYYLPEVFAELDAMVAEGRMAAYGVSVERVEEALKAIEYPHVATVQIIFNPFRQRPAGLFFAEAARRGVGVIVRVPLASGLLSGKYTRETTFAADDHRNFNRRGEQFDVGETFAGVPFEVGLDAVDELRPLVPGDATLAQFALRWILMHDAVSTVIPGARNPEQARANAAAAALPALDAATLERVREVYDARIAPYVHQRW